MSAITPDRIVELWPSLSEEARQQIAEIAEGSVGRDTPLDLTDEEERLLTQSREDFKHGRTLDIADYNAEMTAFMQRLATKATP